MPLHVLRNCSVLSDSGLMGPAAQARVCVHISHIHSTYTVAACGCARTILYRPVYTHTPEGPDFTPRADSKARQPIERARRRDPEVRARFSHSFARGGGSPGPPPVRVSCSVLSAVVGASVASASDSPSSAHSRLHSSGVMATRRRCARKPASPAQGTQPASTKALGSSRSGGVSGAGAPRAAAMARCSGMGTSS